MGVPKRGRRDRVMYFVLLVSQVPLLLRALKDFLIDDYGARPHVALDVAPHRGFIGSAIARCEIEHRPARKGMIERFFAETVSLEYEISGDFVRLFLQPHLRQPTQGDVSVHEEEQLAVLWQNEVPDFV